MEKLLRNRVMRSSSGTQEEGRKCARCVSGSYTVEAAFVVPIVVWVLVVVIFGALYLHDVTITKAELMELAAEGGAFAAWDVMPGGTETLYEHKLAGNVFRRLRRDDEKEAEAYLLAIAQDRIGIKLAVSTTSELNVTLSNDRVTVSVMVTGGKGRVVQALLPKLLFRKTIRETAELSSHTTWNRLVHATIRTGLRIKGVREICEKLDSILERLGK